MPTRSPCQAHGPRRSMRLLPPMQMTTKIVVYHAPQLYPAQGAIVTNHYVFFLPSTDPTFIRDQRYYWFASDIDRVRNRADWWMDEHGEKKKLILKCEIPADSTLDQIGVYCEVNGEDVVILEKMWFDK